MKNLLINSGTRFSVTISKILSYKLVQTLLCSWLIVVGAYITVPFYPVPMTLQTFVIALISLLMPFQVTIGSIILYLSYAGVGIPVLTGGGKGITALVGPTAGYVIGFFFMAAIINLLIKSYPTSGILRRFLFTCIGGIMLFLMGLAHLSHLFDWSIAIKTGLLPFVFSEPVKLLLAAYLSLLLQGRFKQ